MTTTEPREGNEGLLEEVSLCVKKLEIFDVDVLKDIREEVLEKSEESESKVNKKDAMSTEASPEGFHYQKEPFSSPESPKVASLSEVKEKTPPTTPITSPIRTPWEPPPEHFRILFVHGDYKSDPKLMKNINKQRVELDYLCSALNSSRLFSKDYAIKEEISLFDDKNGTIESKLQQYINMKKYFDLIHVSAHGTPHGLFMTKQENRNNNNNNDELVKADSLLHCVDIFKRLATKDGAVVVFACCESENLTTELLKTNSFYAVYGTHRELLPKTALKFTRGIYKHITKAWTDDDHSNGSVLLNVCLNETLQLGNAECSESEKKVWMLEINSERKRLPFVELNKWLLARNGTFQKGNDFKPPIFADGDTLENHLCGIRKVLVIQNCVQNSNIRLEHWFGFCFHACPDDEQWLKKSFDVVLAISLSELEKANLKLKSVLSSVFFIEGDCSNMERELRGYATRVLWVINAIDIDWNSDAQRLVLRHFESVNELGLSWIQNCIVLSRDLRHENVVQIVSHEVDSQQCTEESLTDEDSSVMTVQRCFEMLVGHEITVPKACFLDPNQLKGLPDPGTFKILSVVVNDNPRSMLGLKLKSVDNEGIVVVLRGGSFEADSGRKRKVHLCEILLRNDVVLPTLAPPRTSFLVDPLDSSIEDIEKATEFAKLAFSAWSKNKEGLIVTLDGEGRNVNALLCAGIPSDSIVVMEMVAEKSFYHRFGFPGVRSVYTNLSTSSPPRFAYAIDPAGFEEVFCGKVVSKAFPASDISRVIAVYANYSTAVVDFRKLLNALSQLPKLTCFAYRSSTKGAKKKLLRSLFGAHEDENGMKEIWAAFKDAPECFVLPTSDSTTASYVIAKRAMYTEELRCKFSKFFHDFRKSCSLSHGAFVYHQFEKTGNLEEAAQFHTPDRLRKALSPGTPSSVGHGSPSGLVVAEQKVQVVRLKGETGDKAVYNGKLAHIVRKNGSWVDIEGEGISTGTKWRSGRWDEVHQDHNSRNSSTKGPKVIRSLDEDLDE